jgi:hypothetical protein
MMGKQAKGLTPAELYIAKKCKILSTSKVEYQQDEKGKTNYDWSKAKHYEVLRPVPNVRKMLESRKNHEKYAGLREVFERIQEGFTSWREFAEEVHKWRQLDKYQGYNVAQFVEAEYAVEGKSDDEINRLLLLEAL